MFNILEIFSAYLPFTPIVFNETNSFRFTATAGTKFVRIFYFFLFNFLSYFFLFYLAGATFWFLSNFLHCWSFARGLFLSATVGLFLRIFGTILLYRLPNPIIDIFKGNYFNFFILFLRLL